MIIIFMKRFIVSLFLLISVNAFALPQGFSGAAKPNSAPQGFNLNIMPNSIKGVKDNAKDGDHVLLQGVFTGEDDGEGSYTFEDKDKNKIQVSIHTENLTLIANSPYFIWGNVKKSLFNCSIELIYISDPQY